MKRLTIVVALFAMAAHNALATAQYPDKIVYEGKEHSLHTNPMEEYFSKHPDKKPQGGVMSTALWRGYLATFEFKDGTLILKDLQIEEWKEAEDGGHDTLWKSVKDQVVPKGKDLIVDWFTGILVIPHGKMVSYVHMGYGSTYSDYILLEIKKGKLTGTRKYDYKAYETFKERQFQAYKKTEAYKKQVEAIQGMKRPTDDPGMTQDEIDSFLRNFIIGYTKEFLVEDDKKKESTETGKEDAK